MGTIEMSNLEVQYDLRRRPSQKLDHEPFKDLPDVGKMHFNTMFRLVVIDIKATKRSCLLELLYC